MIGHVASETLRGIAATAGGLLTAAALALTAANAGTLSWTASAESLQGGETDGVAVSATGRLFLAPRLSALGSARLPGEPVQVWSMASDATGNLYLGTGPDGHVLEVTPAGDSRIVFTADEPLVTALALTPAGDLLAGTSPGGLIYRFDTSGNGDLWSETEERYIWSLAVGADGAVYAGTGERGTVLRINRSGSTEAFFDSDESHVVTLVPLKDGGLLAGGAGRGLVYRIDRDGNAIVLHDDDELPEVVALAEEPDGAVLAAFVSGPSQAAPRPEVELRLPDGVQVGTTNESVGQLEETSGPKLRGFIEGLPGAPRAAGPAVRGRLIRISADGRIDELWRSTRDAPFSLLRQPGGRTLFGTGEPASLYGIDDGGDVALLAVLPEAQVTGLVSAGRSVFAATSNPAAAYRLEDDGSDSGVFVSPPFDAGGPARWGSIRWQREGTAGRMELYTRTGNSAEPDDTWSAWSPAMSTSEGSAIVNPDGRFLQWRARLSGSRRAGDRLSSVTVRYEPYNRAPQVRNFHARGETASGTADILWSALDVDGDPVRVVLEYRPRGAGDWTVLGTDESPRRDAGAPASNESAWAERTFAWDTSAMPEGRYELRATASDEAAHPPGEGRRVPMEPGLWLTVDRTAPEIEIVAAADRTFEVRVTDAYSPIRRLEVVEADRTRFTARAEDGVCDSRRESFRFELPADGGPWTVRGTDDGGNSAVAELTP